MHIASPNQLKLLPKKEGLLALPKETLSYFNMINTDDLERFNSIHENKTINQSPLLLNKHHNQKEQKKIIEDMMSSGEEDIVNRNNFLSTIFEQEE